jgi:hypothetical protein
MLANDHAPETAIGCDRPDYVPLRLWAAMSDMPTPDGGERRRSCKCAQ